MDYTMLAQLGVNPQSGVPLAPHWGWYVVLYFFIGGIAAGSYAIACALDGLGDPRDREAVKLGYRLAFPGVVICGILLVLDLGQPLRFWHLLFMSQHFPELILKPWSPISLGSWILTVFGAFAFAAFGGTLVDDGKLRWKPLVKAYARARQLPKVLRNMWLTLGAIAGFALAGYTGVLMMGTTRPVWHNAYLLGGLFLVSAFSTSYAFLALALLRRGKRAEDVTIAKLDEAERWSLRFEIALLGITILWLGSTARPFLVGGYGALFWIGVVGVGLLTPLILGRLPRRPMGAERRAELRAMCVLIGGLTLRFVLVMAPQWPRVAPWHL